MRAPPDEDTMTTGRRRSMPRSMARVIEQTIRQKLPEGFQRSEFLLERGMLDLVVDRREMKAIIGQTLKFMYEPPAITN